MTTYRNRVLQGDALSMLRTLPDGIVQTCVTSPPYWGLRDYGHEGQIGLEDTPEAYVNHLVEVFREVRRVLREDGTLWLNIGDSYANDGKWGGSTGGKHVAALHGNTAVGRKQRNTGLKPKDLVGIPWRVAFALQADGWWLRAENIWAKPNVMPESVTDRTTRAHEHVFLFAKAERYFYDADAIREPFLGQNEHDRTGGRYAPPGQQVHTGSREAGAYNPAGRNKRSVWTITPKPYKGAHFAVFPPELPEVCIKAGTSERGCCSNCGAPYRRTTKRPERPVVREEVQKNERDGGMTAEHGIERTGMSHFKYNEWLKENPPQTVGWDPSCKCEAGVVPCVVLDPFSGSGTTLAVAKGLRRDYLGIELNPGYIGLIEERLRPAEEHAAERSGFDLAMDLEEEG